MSPELHQLYLQLADGERHNGADLARQLRISRAAVWKRIESLRRLGLQVTGEAGSGYRIDRALEVLDADQIRAHLDAGLTAAVAGAVDSTNARLIAGGKPVPHGHALVAEAQTGGRGRRGRNWHSPPGGIYLSLGWHFESGLAGLSPLSLVVGMAAATAIRQTLDIDVKVKWPNDLFVDGRKLGGCLVEMSGAAEGPCQAVIGIGINTYFPPSTRIGQPWTCLTEYREAIPRNRLTATLVNELARQLHRLDTKGFEHFAEDWHRLDALEHQPVRTVQANGATLTGLAEGVDEQGRLLIRTPECVKTVSAGEVSIRVR